LTCCATCSEFRSSCCQIRRMRQPLPERVPMTIRSRRRFRSSFAAQNSRLFTGMEPWAGHPCQKQPSTKTASRARRNTKSGLPKTFARLRQPVILWSRKIDTNRNSVARFPRLFTRPIISDRLAGLNTSAMSGRAYTSSSFENCEPLRTAAASGLLPHSSAC
jgi:hypothetical protein